MNEEDNNNKEEEEEEAEELLNELLHVCWLNGQEDVVDEVSDMLLLRGEHLNHYVNVSESEL